MNVVLETSDLTKRYGRTEALRGCDLSLAGGKVTGLVGPNGAGKTTLLRLIATAARPCAGRLELFGLEAGSQRERLRGRLGYLGHQPAIYPELSVKENLLFAARPGHWDLARIYSVLPRLQERDSHRGDQQRPSGGRAGGPSRRAGPPHFGHVTLRNSGTLASGDCPVPVISTLSGNTTGS